VSDDPPAAAKPRIAASSAGQIEPNAITPSAICGVRPEMAIAAGKAAPFCARKGCGDSIHCERVQLLARRLAEVLQGVDARAFLDEVAQIADRGIRREKGVSTMVRMTMSAHATDRGIDSTRSRLTMA
jgi:hypothetical protein